MTELDFLSDVDGYDTESQWLRLAVGEAARTQKFQHRFSLRKTFDAPAEISVGLGLPREPSGKQRQKMMKIEAVKR